MLPKKKNSAAEREDHPQGEEEPQAEKHLKLGLKLTIAQNRWASSAFFDCRRGFRPRGRSKRGEDRCFVLSRPPAIARDSAGRVAEYPSAGELRSARIEAAA